MPSIRHSRLLPSLLLALASLAAAPGPAAQAAEPSAVFQRGHSEQPAFMTFLDEGHLVTCAPGELFLWSFPEGKLLAAHEGLGRPPALAVEEGGRTCLVISERGLVIVDPAAGRILRRLVSSKAEARFLLPSPDRRLLAATMADGSLHLLELASGKAILSLEGEKAYGLAFSPDGRVLASAGPKKLRLREARTGRLLGEHATRLGRGEGPFFIGCRPAGSPGWESVEAEGFSWTVEDGQRAQLAESRDGSLQARFGGPGIRLYRSAETEPFRELELGAGFRGKALALSPDGSRVLTADDEDAIRSWDLGSLAELPFGSAGPGPVDDLQVSPDGRWLFVHYQAYGPDAESLSAVWDLRAGRLQRRIVSRERLAGSWGFLPDGARYISVEGGGLGGQSLSLRDIATGKSIREFRYRHPKGYGRDWLVDWAFLPGGKRFITVSDVSVVLWDVDSDKPIEVLTGKIPPPLYEGGAIAVSSKGDRIALRGEDGFYAVYSTGDWKKVARIENEDRRSSGLAFVDGDRKLRVETFLSDGSPIVWVYDIATGKYVKGGAESFPDPLRASASALIAAGGFGPRLLGRAFFAERPGAGLLYVGSRDGLARIIDPSRKAWCGLYLGASFGKAKAPAAWIAFDGKGYWDGSAEGAGLVAMSDGWRSFGLEQFAARNNRPDLVLAQLGCPDPEAIGHYRQAYQKRLTRLGLSDAAVSAASEPPSARVASHAESGASSSLVAELAPAASGRPIVGYRIYANGAPLGSGAWQALPASGGRIEAELPLVPGQNLIEVSCLDAAGAESARAGYRALGPAKALRRLFFVGFGVSRYADRRLDLRYAAKDAEDLAAAFAATAGRGGFSEVLAKTWLDAAVRPEALAETAAFLGASRPEDTAVLFIAGHGVHDRGPGSEYYYLSHNANPADLAGTAMRFESIEGLLSGIPARQKLLLMDTCESGEADEAELPAAAAGQGGSRMASRGAAILADGSFFGDAAGGRGLAVASARPRPWLRERDRYIDVDLRRRTGAVVLSSCRGSELSYESAEAENGFFTEALLAGLGGAADEDRNGETSVDELRAYAAREVARLSGGLQNPVVDRDNAIVSRLASFPLPAAARSAASLKSLDLLRFGPGSFAMSGSKGDKVHPFYVKHESKHKVELTRPFLLATAETTVEEFALVMEWARSRGYLERSSSGTGTAIGAKVRLFSNEFQGPGFSLKEGRYLPDAGQAKLPARCVSWYGAAAYCAWRSEMEGLEPAYDLNDWSLKPGAKGYRLPTEAEWEYAARSGGKSMIYSWGSGKPRDENLYDEKRRALPGNHNAEPWAGYDDGFPDAAPVASFRASASGLFDVSGNVSEWCQDGFGYPSGADEVDPRGGSGDERVYRGGSYESEPGDYASGRLSARPKAKAETTVPWIGFRVARDAD